MLLKSCVAPGAKSCVCFFENDIVQRRRLQHARTLTRMNTRTQTLPLWAPPKDWTPADMEIPEVTNDVSSSTGTSLTTYHITPVNPGFPGKGASTRIWTLVGSVPLDRHTIGLQAQSRQILCVARRF
jgi:hypothetical protein